MSLEKKTYSIFHDKNKNIAMGFNTMNICNTQIKRVKEAKYLGLILDQNLIFSSHIDYLLKTLIKYASSFKMIIIMFLPNASYNYIMLTCTLKFCMELKYLVTLVVVMLKKSNCSE